MFAYTRTPSLADQMSALMAQMNVEKANYRKVLAECGDTDDVFRNGYIAGTWVGPDTDYALVDLRTGVRIASHMTREVAETIAAALVRS